MHLGPYNKSLRCYPVIMMAGKERKDVDRGGKSEKYLIFLTRL
jgi:hypothetical protein